MNRRAYANAAAVLPLLAVAVLFATPLVALAVRGFGPAGAADALRQVLGSSRTWSLVGFTLWQAALSVVATLLVAAPVTWAVVRSGSRRSRWLTVIATVPFVLPTVVVGMAFRALLGDAGPLAGLHLDGTLAAILCAHAYLNVAVVVRVVAAVWSSLDTRAEETARSLGASPMRAFLTVVAPRLLPALASASALVFLFCATSFGVIIVLGNGRIQTLETEIYQQAINYFDIPTAVVLTLLQIMMAVVVAAVTLVVRRPAGGAARARIPVRPTRVVRLLLWTATAWTVVMCVVPIALLILRSVRPEKGGAWTVAGYRALTVQISGQSPLSSLRYSLVSATVAMVVALVCGVSCAVVMRRARNSLRVLGSLLLLLPLGVSAVTIGFGYLIVASYLPRDVSTSAAVIPVVQAVVAIPVVFRMVTPALQAVGDNARDSAAVLGATPWRVWWSVDLPSAARALTAAAGFAFLMAVGEFGATSFLTRPGTTSLPVMIGVSLGRPGASNLAVAMASSVLLLAVAGAAVAAIEFVRRDADMGL